jgi:hypothetical protein
VSKALQKGCAPLGAVDEQAERKQDKGGNCVELLEGARAFSQPERREPAANMSKIISRVQDKLKQCKTNIL